MFVKLNHVLPLYKQAIVYYKSGLAGEPKYVRNFRLNFNRGHF